MAGKCTSRMTVKQLIERLQEFDPDADVYVTTVENYSFRNIEVTGDEDPAMGNDVYITGFD